MIDRFDLIVFDWDGTLIDSTAAIVAAIQAAAADLGQPVPDARRCAHVIGLGLQDALALAVPQWPRERAAEFTARYRHHYFAVADEQPLFAGVPELLDALRAARKPLAIATGKGSAALGRALAVTGVADRFAGTRCADQTDPKPHPAMLLELARELGAAPARILMIGDTTHDLQMAKAAGTSAVGVTYGAHPKEELAQHAPLALVHSIAELRQWLLPT